VFAANCSRCHSASGDTAIVGPSLAGIAARAGERIEGMDAEGYIRDSILNPTAYTVEGFPEGIMPLNFEEELSPEDLDAIVVYLLTLK
jgi:mono/diheme cytochrome c family protein